MQPFRTDWLFRCMQCGHLSASSPVQISDDNWSSSFDQDRHRIAHEDMRKRVYFQILDELSNVEPIAGKRVLDVGCSYGWFLDCANEKGMVAYGVDPDLDRAEFGRQAGLNIWTGYFPQAVPEGESFDFIIFNDVFEHFGDLVSPISACTRLLKPGGMLILNIPSTEGPFFKLGMALQRLGYAKLFDRSWQRGSASPHLHFFSPQNLCTLLSTHGFKEVLCTWVPTIDGVNVWKRIRIDKSVNLFHAVLAWVAIRLMLPLLNHLPPDTRLQVFRKVVE